LININYKKLDHFYQKSLNSNELDERIFFRERAANLTPSKFTPFARQGYANKVIKNNNIKLGGNFNMMNIQDTTLNKESYNSHRILNYDSIDKQ
jgi:hypothetical protein